jgi:nicotinamidase-related amidase
MNGQPPSDRVCRGKQATHDESNAAAVLVIDVQAGLFSSTPPPFEAETVLDRINEITAKARAAGVPVILIQQDGEPGGDWLVPLTEAWQFDRRLQVEPGDLVIRKTTCDAFYGTSLESELSARQVSTLVLTGFATDFCVDSTLRNALSKNYAVIVVADAHTTTDSPVLKAAQIRQHYNWAWAESLAPNDVMIVPAAALSFRAKCARFVRREPLENRADCEHDQFREQ